MPKLGDFLGDLLTEVTMARVQADLESVRVAELYANHPLLKHMPVPRFRLPAVHFDLPVLIRGEEDGGGGAVRMDAREAATNFLQLLDDVLDENDWKLYAYERRRAHRYAVAIITEQLDLPPDVAGSITGTVNELVKMAIKTVRRRVEVRSAARGGDPEHLLSLIREGLRKRLMTAFIRFIVSPRRLQADITTSHVKEAGDADTLARVKMEVTEDGVEWATVVDRDGELTERLVGE